MKYDEKSLKNIKEKILKEAFWLKSKAESIIKEVEREDCSFNPLGELQGCALHLDKEIIIFETIKRCLK